MGSKSVNTRHKSESLYEEECFYLRNIIEEYRRTHDTSLAIEVRDLLKPYSKTAIYKYLAVLGPFGYNYKSLLDIWYHYVFEFMNDIEFPCDIIRYFVGYLKHRFYRILEKETRRKRESNQHCESLETILELQNQTYRYFDTLDSKENIPDRYNGQEIYDKFIDNENSDYLSIKEKKIVNLKCEGNTFYEISNLFGITYRQVVHIYNKAIDKMREIMFGFPNSLQNSSIF